MKLTQELLKSVLHYDPSTGLFTWISNRKNAILLGAVAGSLHGSYIVIEVFRKKHKAHRLAWLYMTGSMPKHAIDHKNDIHDDNRWTNLREAAGAINQENKRHARKDNVTGFLGVRRKRHRFEAQIQVKGKKMSLGHYGTAEEAHYAYLHAKRQYHEGCTI